MRELKLIHLKEKTKKNLMQENENISIQK